MGKRKMLVGLKKIRKERKLSQQQVGNILNLAREAISYYENGKREPSLDTLKKLSESFNVSIDYIINGHEFIKR